MKTSALIMATVFAVAGSLGTTAWADQKPASQEQSPCTVMGHRVVSVTPRWIEDINGKRTRHLEGADIRILAERGMTAEYLTVEMQRHVAAMAGSPMPDCVLGVDGASTEVRSEGDGFVFRVTAPDRGRANEIVRRARLLK